MKNGIEKTKLTNESRKENSSAPRLNKIFFCVIAANAERKADRRAIANQIILIS